MNTVRVSIRTTTNIPSQMDLFVEVDEISAATPKPVAAFNSLKAAAIWLRDAGFTYVIGTNGVYHRDTATARKNALAEYRHADGGRRADEKGLNEEQQQVCGVRRITEKLGRLGATLRPRPGSVAGTQRGEAAN
jgi:hypothetical protein